MTDRQIRDAFEVARNIGPSLTVEQRMDCMAHAMKIHMAVIAFDARRITLDQFIALTKMKESDIPIARASAIQATLITLAEIESIPTSGIN